MKPHTSIASRTNPTFAAILEALEPGRSSILHLTPTSEADRSGLAEALGSPEVRSSIHFLEGASLQPGEVSHWLLRAGRGRETGTELLLSLQVRDEYVGSINLHLDECGTTAEIGYWVHPRWHRMGLASRAVERLVTALESVPALRQLRATCAIDNVASQRVLEHNGFDLVETWHNAGGRRSWLYELDLEVARQ